MRAIAILIISFLLLALESPLLHHLHLSFYAPDFGLIVVLYLGMRFDTATGVVTAMFVGLLEDGFSLGSPLGMHMHVAVVVLLLTRALSTRLDIRPTAMSILVAGVASLLSSVLFLLLTLIFDRTFDDYALVLRMLGPQALITAPFAPIIFLLLEKVDRITTRRRHGTIFFQ